MKIYYNGNILTMDKAIERTEALAISKDKISAIGALVELKKIYPEAELVDLRGRTLMPAFVDGHSHIMSLGSFMEQCNISECRSFDEILDKIRKYREEKKLFSGERIRCYAYDLAILKENAHPTAAVLDTLGFDNPIGCWHVSRHMAVYNSIAMKEAGVDDSYTPPFGGTVGRDSNGHLNGYFEESANRVMSSYMTRGVTESFEDNFLRAEEEYLRNGITTIQDGGGVTEEKIKKYIDLDNRGKIRADIVLYLEPRLKDPDFWKRAKELVERSSARHIKIGGVKIVLDGSPQAKTAWMLEPYANEDDYRGYPNHKDEVVMTLLDRATDSGMQVLAHCNGDAAAEQFISAAEAVSVRKPNSTALRHTMIHAQTVSYSQLDRMKKIGMLPSFFVGHCYYWGDTHLKNFGNERGSRISPLRAALDREMIFSLHQDSPVTMPNMLHSVFCAVNRITRSGKTVGEENRIPVYDALVAATHGGAYCYSEENTKGILKPGAVADLIILDSDPTKITPMDIKGISVLETVKSGITVFKKQN